MQLTNKGDPPSVHIDLYNLAELNDLKFKIKMFKINHQIIFGTSIILGSDRNSLRYLLTLNTSGESGVPK